MDQDAESAAFSYDRVAYPSVLFPDQSPDRLRVSALLHGLDAANPATASVLEIGCGTGLNLLAHAAAYPHSRAVGFDLAHGAIAKGRDLATAAGLDNAELAVGDILTWPHDGMQFDYIVCHGVYSWVPEPVREGLLALIAAKLAPGGIAYLSFEILPGAAAKAAIVRLLRRGMVETDNLAEAAERAAATIATLSRNQSENSTLRLQLDTIARTRPWENPSYFFHDWLAEHYTPVDLAAFIDRAAGQGLRVAGTAGNYDVADLGLDAEGAELLASFGDDPAQRLLGLEMLQGPHPFHRSLLIRDDAPPPATLDAVHHLSLGFDGWRREVETDEGTAVRFGISDATFATTNHPASISLFDSLMDARPDELGLAGIVSATGLDATTVGNVIGEIASGYLVHAHASPQPFVSEPGERPEVTRLSRVMLATDNRAISLRGVPIDAGQPETSLCLQLCDGTRTRTEIAAEMSRHFGQDFSVGLIDSAIAIFAAQRVFVA